MEVLLTYGIRFGCAMFIRDALNDAASQATRGIIPTCCNHRMQLAIKQVYIRYTSSFHQRRFKTMHQLGTDETPQTTHMLQQQSKMLYAQHHLHNK